MTQQATHITISELDRARTTHIVYNLPAPKPIICSLNVGSYNQNQRKNINDFSTFQHEPSVERSKDRGLWFVAVKLHDPEAMATQAMVDTGCTLTCIRDTAWNAIDRATYCDYDMDFTTSNGTVIGATGKMRTKIVGHAIIRLIFQSQAGENFTIFTRAMIVEDLQGPIYLGQDIFQARHIFHSLTRDHMHILYKHKMMPLHQAHKGH